MHRYFIAYTYSTRQGVGVGTSDIGRGPIRSHEDIEEIAEAVRRANPGMLQVTITGWQRFED